MNTSHQPDESLNLPGETGSAGDGSFSHEEPTLPVYQALPTMPVQPGATPGIGSPLTARPRSGTRRKFMGKSLVGVAAAGGTVVVGGVALGEWLSHREPTTASQTQVASNLQIGHLLRRAGFGANAAELSTYSNLGYQGAVERLLNYQQVDDSVMEQRLQALNLNMNSPQDMQRWWILRMAWSQRPLLEKMTLFWHGVLTSSYRKVGGPKVYQRMSIQNNFLRAHAFDTFDNVLLGITSDPAMLFYLDLTTSTKTHPNENYAREMMELFTVGVANYTQEDVSAGAAALTGWHVRGLTSYYNPNTHSTLPVHYMGTSAPMFLLGNGLNKGVFGEPPGLSNLDSNGNLKYTIDFRSVYATVLDRWMGASSQDVLGGSFGTQNFLPAP